MVAISRRTFAALALGFGLATMLSAPLPISAADDKEIANALRAGGLIIVVRHGSTFRDQADTDPLHYDNVAAQRNLNDAGRATARAFGEAFRQIGVPIGEVYTSQFNRAYETAVLAGFKDIIKSVDITEGGLVVSPNENDRRTAAFRKLLAVAPKPGTDTVIITHKPNIVDALGKDWLDVKRAKRRSSNPKATATSSSPGYRWMNGLASRRRSKAKLRLRSDTSHRARVGNQILSSPPPELRPRRLVIYRPRKKERKPPECRLVHQKARATTHQELISDYIAAALEVLQIDNTEDDAFHILAAAIADAVADDEEHSTSLLRSWSELEKQRKLS